MPPASLSFLPQDNDPPGSKPSPVQSGTDSRQESSRAKGASAEDAAVGYLTDNGYAIVERNYQIRNGEIDCIARDKDGTLVFVEVKSSRTGSCGHPFFWVGTAKQRKLSYLARWYLSMKGLIPCPCRFDVIAVVSGKIEHLKNAFLVR